MRLMHNVAALNIYRNYSKTIERQGSSMERISSGYKINKAQEDPNALAKSERMRMQIRGLSMASRNVQDGVSMFQTVEGGLENLTSILQRVKELGCKYGNDTNNENDKEIIQNEINQLIEGYDGICNNTEFNGKKLLGENKEIEIAVGTNEGEAVKVNFYNVTSSNLQVNIGGTSYKLEDLKDLKGKTISSSEIVEIADNAMNYLIGIRTKYGAVENKFESTMNRVGEISDRIEGAESQVRDVDIAEESLELVRDNILVEASNSMMVQTNKFPQDVLKILENVRNR